MFIGFILLFSLSSIQAADVNATDADALNSADAISLQIEDASQLDDDADDALQSIEDAALTDGAKNQTQLTSPTTTIYQNGNYQVTLMDSSSSAPLAGKTVKFSINNAKYEAATGNDGIASVNVKLNPGTYSATAYFAGDADFEPSNTLSGQITILSTIKASDITKYYKGSASYQATFLDSQGKPLNGKYVTLTLSGKKYSKKTNANGVATLPINFKPGAYKVTATNPVTGYQITTNFKILSTIEASDVKKVRGDAKKFTAKFYKSNGKPLANQKVKIKVKGKTSKYKTNSNGQVSLALNKYGTGTFKIVCYNKDGLSRTSTVKIYYMAPTKITVGSYTFLENETKEIKIKFSTALDDSSKAGKSIEIFAGDDYYTKKTNANGEITLRLSNELEPDLYAIECYYWGDSKFEYSRCDSSFSVLGTTDTKLAVKGKTSFGNNAGTPLDVALTAGGVPIVNKNVVFTVNGKNYNVATDDEGIASFPVNLNVGTYTVNYKTAADSKLKASSGSCNITVFKRANTKFTFSFKSTIKDSTRSLKVLLKDASGKPVKYANVDFYVNGELFDSASTNSKGYATFYSSLSYGKYKVTVKFKGNNDYTAKSASKTVKVTISKYKNGINEKGASASGEYLKGSKNAPTNNGKIKSLVKKLTKGLTSKVDKARAIFYYVRDKVSYDYYYGTQKGAIGTLNSKKANCVDQSHLLVSMFRTAGIKARYVQGVCTYSDGTFYHYWTQIVLDNTWICADPVNSCNELGQINDWNTKTFRFVGKYVNA